MPLRTRGIRRLASLLTRESGTSVKIYYDRAIRRYHVVWTDGPDVAQMYTLVMRYAPEASKLDPSALLWERGTNKGPVPGTTI